ncbi:hypothetical protein BJY52DRAFT_1187737 [Lactarius psammicola]|nr:hypothetical protein BJY52DRAFT_1187737 [Lactarius psammicola]
MSSLPVDGNPLLRGLDATFIPNEGIPVVYHKLADATAICYQLLRVLDIPHNVLNASQLWGPQALPDSAVSATHTQLSVYVIPSTQLELVRVACHQLLQVLGLPYSISNAAEHQVLQDPSISVMYPQLEFVGVAYLLLLHVYKSLLAEAIQLEEHQVHRDFAISEMFPLVDLAATHVKFVLVACYQLLQVCGMPPGDYNATQLGEHQVLTENVSPIQHPTSETAQPADAQEATVPAGGDTSDKLRCLFEDCKVTFRRLQERKRHLIDVHTPRRRCPFCLYAWSRPDKIKTHLMTKHQDKPQVLNEIQSKCGQRLVAFLDTL